MTFVMKATKACFKRRATAVLSWLDCTVARLQHDTSMIWFQTSRYCRAKVEFDSINLVRHGSSTTFETGL